jgi:hypothetical protein
MSSKNKERGEDCSSSLPLIEIRKSDNRTWLKQSKVEVADTSSLEKSNDDFYWRTTSWYEDVSIKKTKLIEIQVLQTS